MDGTRSFNRRAPRNIGAGVEIGLHLEGGQETIPRTAAARAVIVAGWRLWSRPLISMRV